jgi:hypothetical protein
MIVSTSRSVLAIRACGSNRYYFPFRIRQGVVGLVPEYKTIGGMDRSKRAPRWKADYTDTSSGLSNREATGAFIGVVRKGVI